MESRQPGKPIIRLIFIQTADGSKPYLKCVAGIGSLKFRKMIDRFAKGSADPEFLR